MSAAWHRILVVAALPLVAGLLTPLGAAEGVTPPLPLPGPGTEAAADAQHLLINLAEGGHDPLWPERPAALPDAGDDGLARRWQAEIPALLARLDGHGAAALAAVDRHCQVALGATRDANQRLGIALDHLPAPSARVELAAAMARAWDHGRLRTLSALAAAAARGSSGGMDGSAADPVGDPRADLARAELFATDRADPLPLTGLPEPVAPATGARSAGGHAGETGLTIAWAARPGWIFGLDAAGRVAWQRAVPLDAEVRWGDGGAVLRSAEGLLALEETGHARVLGPLPARARLLAVAGAAAWFVLDARAWRVGFDGAVVAGDLGEEPVAPPLAVPGAVPGAPPGATSARSWRSLWLTPRAVLWWAADGTPQRLRHGLPVGPGWSLAWASGHDGADIVAPDGRRWHLPGRVAVEDGQGADGVLLRCRLATASGRPQEALDLLSAMPEVAATEAGQRVALQAHVALGPEHLRQSRAEVGVLVNACAKADPVLATAVLYAVNEALRADPQPTVGTPSGWDIAFHQALTAAKAAQPMALFSRKPDEAVDDPAEWRHALSADGLDLALHAAADRAAPPGPGWQWSLEHPEGWTEVACRDAAGNLIWRHRWPTDPSVPSRALARSGDWLLVAEGQDRLLVLTAATGDLVLAAPLGGAAAPPESVRVLSPRRLAVLEPAGVDDHLLIFDVAGPPVEVDGPVPWALPSSHPLPVPARTLDDDAGHAVVTLTDGRTLRF